MSPLLAFALGAALASAAGLILPEIWDWLRRGGPDYLDEPEPEHRCLRCGRPQPSQPIVCQECWDELDDALLAASPPRPRAAPVIDFIRPFDAVPDRSWPRDTGTKLPPPPAR